MTTIDIMMPFYGDPALMREAVASVLKQDDPSWRLTIIDDATPNLAASRWIQSLDHPAVTYHRNPKNLGVNGNFNQCLELATAEYVVFMGCDDVMLPEYVSRMRAAITRQPEAAIIQPGVATIDELGRPVSGLADRVKRRLAAPHYDRGEISGECLVRSLLRGNWCYFPSLCWRRQDIAPLGFRTGLDLVLDLALIVDVAIAGGSLLLSPDVTFQYRRHDASASSILARSGERFEEERVFFRDVAQRCRTLGWKKAARAADLHLTSRLHAASLIPSALMRGHRRALGEFLQHSLYA